MKCPNCGGEIENNAKFCTFCGSQITVEMQKEREQLNKSGCPKCGSTNVTFNREKQGELKGKNGTVVVRSTIGLCKDCGYTWSTTNTTQPQKKNKTWLWVLGWIFVFPVPLTILMLRKKDMKPALKYGIIAAAWIVYLIIGLSGNSNDNTATTGNNTETIVSENETINDDVTTNIVESQTDSEVVEQTETNYADDEIVNKFITILLINPYQIFIGIYIIAKIITWQIIGIVLKSNGISNQMLIFIGYNHSFIRLPTFIAFNNFD